MTGSIPVPAEQVDTAVAERAARSHLFLRLLRNPAGLISLIVLVAVALVAVLADVLAPFDPTVASVQDVLAPPSSEHLLGADSAGRDILSRLLLSTRYSLAGAVWAVLVAAVIGVTTGLVAGYYSRWFESVSLWTASLVQAMPAIILLLAARSVLGPSIWLMMGVFGVILSPAFFRLVYSAVLNVKHELYVDAARVAGVGDASIIARHILSVVRAPIVIQASILVGISIAVQSGLDFLGVGDPTIPTWGQMLNDAFTQMYRAPHMLIYPALAIAIPSIALVLLGNALRDELEQSGSRSTRRRRAAMASSSPTISAPAVHAEERADQRGVLLDVEDLVVGYDQRDGSRKTVVNGVSLTVRKGEIHGLIGESGSGKTQTAWSVLRLLPDGGRIVSGTVTFDGRNLASLKEGEMRKVRGARIAYIPQEPMSNLDPTSTIGSQLVEPMVLAGGMKRNEARARALDLLARVGIPYPDRTFASYPHELSGGMAQRVLIAGAVSCNADLIIADEPTTALDVTVQAEILDLLRELQRETQVSVLIVTHNFGVVADLCDRVSVMQNGTVVETGPVRSVFAAPLHPYTKALFDAVLEDGASRGRLVHSSDRNLNSKGSQS